MKLTRRSILRASAFAAALPAVSRLPLAAPAAAQGAAEPAWRHALSLFGDIKYPDGFKHFDYVNPQAPQGGTVRRAAIGTFDNFNSVVADTKGSLASGLDLVLETLTTRAFDEVSTVYGLLAEAMRYPED